jgi:hypothetical protein
LQRDNAPRRQLVQPQQLRYESAAQGTALADWLFDLDRLFRQLGFDESAAAQRIGEASLHWDRQIDIWWQGRKQQAAASGTPLATWAAFVAALQANFVPTGDAEAAARELLRLRMKAGEAMDAYMQRAALLLARCDGRIDATTAARIAVEGVDSARFPFALAGVRATLRKNVTLGFHEVRLELTEAAVHEPRLASAAASSSGGGSTGGSIGSYSGRAPTGAAKASKQLRINALERQLAQLRAGDVGSEDEEGNAALVHTAAVARGTGGSGAGAAGNRPQGCNKCGALGHVAVECRSKKELRTCFVCGQPGHIAARCDKRKEGREGGARGGEGSGLEGAAKSKNE